MPKKEQTEHDKQLTKSYGMAMAWLREENLTRFNELRVKAAQQLGVEWKPKPTEAQAAAQQFHDLIGRHPELLDEVARQISAGAQQPASTID